MALQFQGYGDPFAKKKMEQQQKQQQFQNLIQALGMAGQGVSQYQDRQRQASMDAIAKQNAQNQQFLFDRDYKPQEGGSNPFMGSDMGQMSPPMGDQGPQNKLSLFQGGQGQPQVSSDIIAMHKKMFPHLANITDSGIPAGMSRADYEDQLKYEEQGAKTANLNAEAKKNAALANAPKSTSIDSILGERVRNGEITLEDALKMKQQSSPTQNRNSENQLRSQFLSQSKDFSDTATSYQRIIDSSKNPTAAGDLSMIYNYMKMLDPGSTVREGEFATAQNAGSIPQSILGQYNKAINGERLAPELRNDFVNRATQLYQGQKKRHDQRVSEFKRIAAESGVNPNSIIVDLSTPEGGFSNTSSTNPQGLNSGSNDLRSAAQAELARRRGKR